MAAFRIYAVKPIEQKSKGISIEMARGRSASMPFFMGNLEALDPPLACFHNFQ